jgi:hypothetical protein
METERIFSADQIKVHPDLARIIREYSKSVIRAEPTDILEFSWKYFKEKAAEDEMKRIKQAQVEADARELAAAEY